MQTITDDPVDVVVSFSAGKVQPWKLRWGAASYIVKYVNLIHSNKEGQQKIFYFNVSDDENSWKLRFNTENLEWRLVEAYTP